MEHTFPGADARPLIRLALHEDVRSGDVTCLFVLPEGHGSRARVVAKEEGILAGLPLLPLLLEELDAVDPQAGASRVTWSSRFADGTPFSRGDVLVELEGPTRALLEVERALLNFLQHLCGVARSAHEYQVAAGPDCRVLDTRKTTPGQRALEKWAIAQGGGSNHRMGLWDAVLIKENHAAAAGGVRPAVELALTRRPEGMPVIAEVRSLQELESLLDLPLDRVLLDNFRPEGIAQARRIRDQAQATFRLEASGGITLDTLPAYAAAGAEFVSVGALTHTVRPVDLSLLLEGT